MSKNNESTDIRSENDGNIINVSENNGQKITDILKCVSENNENIDNIENNGNLDCYGGNTHCIY